MSVDLRRSRSLSQDLRPRVSFNRDVHVKRYGGKKPLGRIEEEEQQLDVNRMRGRRGKADGTDFNTRRSSMDDHRNDQTITISVTPPTPTTVNTPGGGSGLSSITTNGRKHHNKDKHDGDSKNHGNNNHQTFGQRLRSLFGGGHHGNSKKNKSSTINNNNNNSHHNNNHNNSTITTSTTTTTAGADPLRSRYKEYRGEEYETKRRETSVSTPETKTSWFRSLDRQPKHQKSKEKSWTDTTDSRYSGSTRTLRYFGESDTEAMRKPPIKYSTGTLRRNHRFLPDSTSQDDTTDIDTNGRSDSVLYLHTATVGRIPSGNHSERSSRIRSDSRNEEHEHRRKRSGRSVVRSVSVASPWRPSHPNNRVIHYSSTDRLSNKSHISEPRGQQHHQQNHHHHRSSTGGGGAGSTASGGITVIGSTATNVTTTTITSSSTDREKYGHLVFTGPSFDDQLKNDGYRNDRRRF